ncbi:hypothetical protein SADUNF_Sadunf12G0077400 [Salix dunnii]|uniref:Uncharacterized protein n=1 Tax=Salix dunnii TaxID=1413687 RepID=A0A835JRJ8_9ROSI|nr:hypothetical protein SADUNF_Sadunf12G0077400 [Salix dunnii]
MLFFNYLHENELHLFVQTWNNFTDACCTFFYTVWRKQQVGIIKDNRSTGKFNIIIIYGSIFCKVHAPVKRIRTDLEGYLQLYIIVEQLFKYLAEQIL